MCHKIRCRSSKPGQSLDHANTAVINETSLAHQAASADKSWDSSLRSLSMFSQRIRKLRKDFLLIGFQLLCPVHPGKYLLLAFVT